MEVMGSNYPNGGMGSYCQNGSNGKLLSKWKSWEVTIQIGLMGSYCPNGSNGKLWSKWEKWEVSVQMGVMGS
jgi:hypothetical protein